MLKKGQYTIVTEENKKALERWRFGNSPHKLIVGCVVGRALQDFGSGKDHNDTTGSNGKNDGYYFNKYISFEDFCREEGMKAPLFNYEIF